MKTALLLATTAAAALVASTTALEPSPSSSHPINATEASTRQLDVFDYATYRLCGVDIVGRDIGPPLAPDYDLGHCLQFCHGANGPYGPECSGASLLYTETGYGCYRKDTQFQSTTATPNVNVDSMFKYKGKWAEQAPVRFYDTMEGFDMAGYDLANQQGVNLFACLVHCNGNAKCFAVTWTDYQGGWCWLKYRASAFIAKPGAMSMFVSRKVTSGLIADEPCPRHS